jgi:3-phosphoshikimate 1-carboxyvinyltransferase
MKQRGLAGHIAAYDANAQALTTGIRMGVIDESADSIRTCTSNSDLIILAVPVLSIREILAELTDVSGIITDVGSVKKPVVNAALEIFGEVPPHLVPGHPIAGSEKHGVQAANPNLFEHHKVILTPADSADCNAVSAIVNLWEALGAQVMKMTPDHHDSVFAQTSHLPHLLAYALVDMLSSQGDSLEIFEYAAGGFRDFSRIAASDPVMWRDVFKANDEKVLDSLDQYIEQLAEIRNMIAAGKAQELEALFKRAKIARDHFAALSSGSTND